MKDLDAVRPPAEKTLFFSYLFYFPKGEKGESEGVMISPIKKKGKIAHGPWSQPRSRNVRPWRHGSQGAKPREVDLNCVHKGLTAAV